MTTANESLPTCKELVTLLKPLKIDPVETHGLLCGLIVAGNDDKIWLDITLANKKSVKEEVLETLRRWHILTRQQFREFDFGFELMLPDDSQLLAKRANALSIWCASFLAALKLSGVKLTAASAEESKEIFADMLEVAQMSDDKLDETEENEQGYIELVEYVRLAVLSVYADLQGES